jgi:hypothetical protein
MTPAQLDAERKLAHDHAPVMQSGPEATGKTSPVLVYLAWAFVGIPLAWGVWVTLAKAWVLFG